MHSSFVYHTDHLTAVSYYEVIMATSQSADNLTVWLAYLFFPVA